MYRYKAFTKTANVICEAVEHPLAFPVIGGVLSAWLLTGALTGFPDFWSSLFSTATGLITFLLLFIIQHNQGRFNLALHIKLNELIRNTRGAHNALLDLEKLNDYDLNQIWAGYATAAMRAREDLRLGDTLAATGFAEVESVLLLIQQGSLSSPKRLAALGELKVLDSPPERAFDRLTKAACAFVHVPIALVSLVDDRRQFFKSLQGLPQPFCDDRETPLSHSFCQYVAAGNKPLVIADAREHPILRENLAIRDLGVVAYCGFPLTRTSGQTVGSFCAIDTKAHDWQPEEISALRVLAHLAMEELEHGAKSSKTSAEEDQRGRT